MTNWPAAEATVTDGVELFPVAVTSVPKGVVWLTPK